MFNFLFSWWVLGSWHCWEHSESDEDWITWSSDKFVICRTFVSIQPFLMMDHRDSWITERETLFEMKSQQFLQIFSNWWSQLNIQHSDEAETFHIMRRLKNHPRRFVWKWNPRIFEMRWMKMNLITLHPGPGPHIPDADLWDGEMSLMSERIARTGNVFRLGSDAVASISSILYVSAIQ